MRSRLKIGLDCDDVLYNCNEFALRKLNAEMGTDYKIEDCSRWVSGSDLTGINARAKYFDNPKFYDEEPVFEGAKEFIEKLTDVAEVFIITSVPAHCASVRMQAIMRDFPSINPKNIIIATRKDVVEVDILLDDGSHNIISARAKYPVLMRRPWNHDVSGQLSVNNYNDFLHFVDVVRFSYQETIDMKNGGVICLVGPSGSGKTAIMEELVKDDKFVKPITTTSRQIRPGESPDAYNFVSKEKFIEMKNRGVFLESTVYADNYYGTSAVEIDKIIADNKCAVIPIDICGAITIKNHYRNKSQIFFINRNKRDVLKGILERDISVDDKINRIVSLDKEYQNDIFCDVIINNNGTLADAASAVRSEIK